MISIDINEDEKRFVIGGDLSPILNSRRVKANFRSIGAEETPELTLCIPYIDNGEKEQKYAQILKLLKKFAIADTQKTDAAAEAVRHIDKENERFNIFAQKALDIRNNRHHTEDFRAFCKVIASKLERKLSPLQILSAYHLAFSQNACNFSVPGAGKTTVVYAAFAYLNSLDVKDEKYLDKIIVIGPLASFHPWRHEHNECFGNYPSCAELVGITERDRSDYFSNIRKKMLTLISYQSAASSFQDIINYLKRTNDRVMIVLDEAHRIKNTEGGKWATSILSIAPYADARVVLTGTPIPNGYEDLYNLYKFIWPTRKIISLYETGSISKYPDGRLASEKVKGLIAKISPFFIRIRKSDLHLPAPIDNEPVMVPMDQKQTAIYEYIEDKLIASLGRKYATDPLAEKFIKAKVIRLTQSATNIHLLLKPLHDYRYYEGSMISDSEEEDHSLARLIKEYVGSGAIPPKFVACRDLLAGLFERAGLDGKAIIWSRFIHNITGLSEYLAAQGISNEMLYGATPMETEGDENDTLTREKIITRFHDEDCPYKVIIANPYAVGESISLHRACRNAIYLDRDYNATTFIQSKDRIHRYGLGKDDKVNYYYLLSEGTIDQVIHDRLGFKESRMQQVIESEEIPLFKAYRSEEQEFNADIAALIDIYNAKKHS